MRSVARRFASSSTCAYRFRVGQLSKRRKRDGAVRMSIQSRTGAVAVALARAQIVETRAWGAYEGALGTATIRKPPEAAHHWGHFEFS
jgi:hypothetical protein